MPAQQEGAQPQQEQIDSMGHRPEAQDQDRESGESHGPAKLDDIATNDGKMTLQIVETARKKDTAALLSAGNYTVYGIKGKDSLGEIDIERRYSEFLMLRDSLFQRYPGILIPPIPSKQFQGNTDPAFVEERKGYLNLFLQKLCQQRHLASSPEVQVFLRPRGSVIESFKNLESMSTSRILRYYQVKIPLRSALDHISDRQVNDYNAQVNAFVKQQQALLNHVKNFQKHANNIVPMKEHELKCYKSFADFLEVYEKTDEQQATKHNQADVE